MELKDSAHCVVAGKIAVIVGAQGLAIANTDPSNPMKLAHMATGVEPSDHVCLRLRSFCQHAYVTGKGGLAIVDISTPLEPKLVCRMPPGGAYYAKKSYSNGCCVVDGNFAFFIGSGGLNVYNVEDPKNAVLVGETFNTGVCAGGGGSITVSEGIAYIVGGLGFAVVDVSAPAAPKLITKAETGVLGRTSVRGSGVVLLIDEHEEEVKGKPVTVATELAYVAGSGGVRVLDVSDPAKPVTVGAKVLTSVVNTTSGARISYSPTMPNLLFVCGALGMAVLDIWNRREPALVQVCETGVATHHSGGSIAVTGETVVCVGGGGMVLYGRASGPQRTPVPIQARLSAVEPEELNDAAKAAKEAQAEQVASEVPTPPPPVAVPSSPE